MEDQDRLLLRSILANVEQLQGSHNAIWAKLNGMEMLHTDVKLLNARLQYLKEFEDSIELLEMESSSNKAAARVNSRWQYALAGVLSLFVPVAIAWFIRVNADINQHTVTVTKIQQQIVYLEERLRYTSLLYTRPEERPDGKL